MTTQINEHEAELHKEGVKELYSILKAINFREHGTIHISKSGVRIICDDSHYQQAIAYLEQAVFKLYELKDDVTFRVPLLELAEVINMLEGNGNTIKLCYDGYGTPLKLMLTTDDNDYSVQASIQTMENETIQDFGEEFNTDEILMSAIFRPEVLKEVIKAWDDSCQSVCIEGKTLRSGDTKLSFIAKSDDGKVTTSFKSTSGLVERMEIPSSISFVYSTRLLKRMQYSLGISSRVAIRIDCQGTLCAQVLLERQESEKIFIEFYCLPNSEEE